MKRNTLETRTINMKEGPIVAYSSRKQQMEDFIKEYRRSQRGNGNWTLKELVRSACMCGAAEERSRALQIIKLADAEGNWTSDNVCRTICEKSVLEVLGYEGRKGAKRHGTS
jgi:hypothetical protein